MPRARRHIHRSRPNLDLSNREEVIQAMLHDLYDPHWKFWNDKLHDLITKNRGFHGRKGHEKRFGLFYAGKAWFVPWMDQVEANQFNILQLHEGYPDMEKDAIRITANLAELDIETYEIQRFLAGLLCMPAPISVMQELLGRALFNRVKTFLAKLEAENRQHLWNKQQAMAFDTYTKEHDYLIDAMCQRVMMNLIAKDAFAKRS